jgi:Xaa-Pro aminopeptidase
MVYDDPAIVAIGRTANNPHYGPTKEIHSIIHRGDLVLIDMWAKIDDPEGVYADITWMGYVGDVIPKILQIASRL